jgi:ubiquinone/menaquinone biosynthesis C-methylase UbiE
LTGEQFERAFLVTVLGEIPDQEKALREIYGLLTPGGILSVTELLPDPHYQRQSVVRELALRTGFIPTVVYSNYRAFTMNLMRPESDECKNGSGSTRGLP